MVNRNRIFVMWPNGGNATSDEGCDCMVRLIKGAARRRA